MSSSAAVAPAAAETTSRGGGSGEPRAATTASTLPIPDVALASSVDNAALDALAAALTTDHGAVDVCRRAAGFLLAHVPGSVAVQ